MQPLAPDRLPPLPRLERLEIPGHKELRKSWVDFAVKHPQVRCVFSSLPGSAKNAPPAKVGLLHKGFAILEFSEGAKRWFEIAGDFAVITKAPKGQDNHDLRERLAAWCKSKKVKAEFSSEAEQLVIRASKPQAVQACLDALLAKGTI
jgi:hypothetical protein